MKILDKDLAGILIFQSTEELPHNPETGGRNAAAVSRMDSFAQQLYRQVSHDQSPQRAGAPELIVIPAARIETDYKAGDADAVRERFDIKGQIVASTFLACFDNHNATGMRRILFFQGTNCS